MKPETVKALKILAVAVVFTVLLLFVYSIGYNDGGLSCYMEIIQ